MDRCPSFKLRQSAILALAINLAFAAPVSAMPLGAMVANGQVAISQPLPGTMQIQASNGAIINWNKFSIGAGEVTRFVQPTSSSAVLNRVVGKAASQLDGSLQANGRVFLINPNGIVIGAGGRVDTNGFIASTLDIADADFLAGKLKFIANGASGSISNQGLISVGPGGRVALIAPNIENSGIIQAPEGKILLAAGRRIEISNMDFDGVSFEVQAPTDSALNLGKLLADNGAVQVFAGTLRHSGEIRANRLVQDGDGSIRLVGSNEVTLTADSVTRADGLAGGSITIQSSAGTARVAGELSARGAEGKGGDIRVLGERVALESAARIDASGLTGGGQILVGGDYQGKNPDVQNARRVFVGDGASLTADASGKGDGGRIIVWADENTRYFGSLAARGGPQGGNGGFAEVSGKQNLEFAGKADLTAPAGAMGFLLLDPLDIIVSSSGGILPIVTDQFSDFSTNILTISEKGMNDVGGNIILQAQNDIIFNSPTNFTGSRLTAAANCAGGTATASGACAGGTGTGSIKLNLKPNEALSTTGGSLDLSGYTVTGSGGLASAGGAVNIHVTSGLAYGGVINSGGGTVTLASTGGAVSNSNVNSGTGNILVTGQSGISYGTYTSGGTVSLNGTTGSIYGNNVTAVAASLNSPSTIYSNYINAGRIDATSSGSYVDLYNLSGQPLRIGTINGSTGVYLHSNAGMQQVSGGLITAPVVYLYGQNSASTLGASGAPLAVASSALRLQNLTAPAFVALSGSPTLSEFYLQGTLAGVAGTSLTGAANLSTFSLSAGAGLLNGNVVSTGGFSSGFSINVSDAGINMPTLTLPGAALSLTAGGGGVTLGNSTSDSLVVSAKGPINATSLTTTGGNLSLTANKCTFYNTICIDNSPITVGTMSSAGSTSLYNYDNGNIGVTSLTAGGSVNVQAGSYYFSYYDYANHRTTNAINVGSLSGTNIAMTDSGTGNILATGNLTATSSSLNVNAQMGAVSAAGANTAGTTASFAAGNGTLALGTVSTTSGNVSGTATGDITFQSIAAAGSNRSVTLTSSTGGIKTTVNNSLSDISATGNVTLSASSSIGDGTFLNPLDILAGSASTVSLTSSTGSIGALGKPVTVDTSGALVAHADGQFHVTVQDASTHVAKTLQSIDLASSAAGMGIGGTSVFSSQDLSVNAASDGSIITIGNIVQSANTLDLFKFAATGTSGLAFGDVNLTTSGQAGHAGYAGYNQLKLSAGKGLTQTSPGTNNINAGYIELNGGTGAVTLGNVTSSSVAGNGIDITGANVNAGNLFGLDVSVSGNDIALGSVTSTGTHRGYPYSSAVYVPRFGYSQYLAERLDLNASGNLTTTGNISSQTSATVSGATGVSVGGGSGNITGGISYPDTVTVDAGSGTLATGAISGYYANVSGTSLNTAALSATGGSLSVTGTNFATGNLSAPGSVTINASGAYVPGAITVSGANINITAPNGINTSAATLTTPTATLTSDNGGVQGTLTGTGNLSLTAAGPINVTSTAALNHLDIHAKGDQLGGSSLITGTGQSFQLHTLGVDTADLVFTSPSPLVIGYTERSDLAGINVTGSLTNYGISNNTGLTVSTPFATSLNVGTAVNPLQLHTNFLSWISTSFSTAGDVNLNAISTTGPAGIANASVTASGANINVDTVSTLGGSVNLSATSGSISKIGTNSVQIDTSDASGAASGSVTLTANNGSVGSSGSPLKISKTVSLAVAAKDAIALDLNNTTLTDLSIATGASGTGAISIANILTNFAGFSLTRAAGNLDLGAVTSPGNFSLTARDGNIRVKGDINVANLRLDASNSGYNTTGDVIIQASGGARSVTASGASYLYAGHDFKILAGAAGGENVSVQAGYTDAYVGHDFMVKGDGGSALLNQATTSSQTINAGHDIVIQGGSAAIAGASAAITSSGSQNLYSGNNLLIQAGSADGASAKVQATSSQTISTGGNVSVLGGAGVGSSAALQGSDLSMTTLQGGLTVQGGSGANASAEIVSTAGGQSIGNQNNPYYYNNPTDFILVQGGGGTGAYASIRSTGAQTLHTVGDVNVLGGGGAGAFAEVYSSGGSQTVGSTGNYWTPATQNILVKAGAGGIARIQALYDQSIMAGGDISVLGGSGTGMTAAIQSTGGSQNIGYTYIYNNDATNNVIVQGGSGSGSSAKIAAYSGQTIDAGQNITLAGGAAGAFAEATTAFGSQTIGNVNSSYNYDQTNLVSLSGGSAAGAYANMTANGNQTVRSSGNVSLVGGNGAGSGALLQGGSGQTLTAYGNLTIAADRTGSDTVVRQTSGGVQNLTVGGSISVTNAAGTTAGIVSGGAQTISATDALVMVSSPVAGARAEISTNGTQTINLLGRAGDASPTGNANLKVLNHSAASGSLAQVKATGNQTISMPYTKAGIMQVGDTSSLGAALVASIADQTLTVGDLLVQGGASAAATSKILAGTATTGTMTISALTGPIQVLGGAAGSAAIDPLYLFMTSNGAILVKAGSAASATALITAGNINMAATNGDITVTGGPVAGATAGILATGTLNAYASGNLAFNPNAGGATMSAGAPTGNNIFLGGNCIGCAGGLIGNFNILTGLLPVVPVVLVPGSVSTDFFSLLDPTAGNIVALLDNLQDLYGLLAMTEEGEITVDPLRRRLPKCY